MKKITKKEINERIKSIMSRESHKNEKIIYKEVFNNVLYKDDFDTIATFKTIDDFGFVTVYNIFNLRNENNELKTVMYSTSINLNSRVCIM